MIGRMIMKIDLRPILKPLALAEYDARMESAVVEVWVNPSRAFLSERDKLIAGLKDNDGDFGQFNLSMFAWYAELWSQSTDEESHWTIDEVREVSDADPALFNWLVRTSSQMLNEHRAQEKKS